MKVNIYTDGSCLGNPGEGGWAAVISKEGCKDVIITGRDILTTNNRMELTALIRALETLTQPCDVKVFSDSRYLIDGLSKGWAASWKRKGWVKSGGKKALNPDLWDRLLTLTSQHNMSYKWVKGHSGILRNEQCDTLAREAASSM